MRKQKLNYSLLAIVVALFTAFVFIFLNACEVGLGQKVNTNVPVIGNGPDGSRPGSYLRGSVNLIQLDVKQDFGLQSVFISIWYNDKNNLKKEKIIPACLNDKGFWEVNIDTADMADGSIRTQVTAVDKSGNITTTTDMIYIVKNIPPQIELTVPRVKGNGFDAPDLNQILSGAPLYQGSDLMGIASDVFGIERGYPQILTWPRDYHNVDENGVVLETDPKWGKWRTVTDDNYCALNTDGLNAVQFRWSMIELIQSGDDWRLPENEELLDPLLTKDLPVGVYRVKFRVMDKFGVVNTYPDRIENTQEHQPNQYMEINLVAAKNPSIKWFAFSQYYNGVEDFTATVNITTPNDRINSVRVMASNNEDVIYKYADNSFVKQASAGNSWVISISADIMREMLGVAPGQKMSGDKILHIEAEDNMGNKTTTTRQFIIDDTAPTLEFIEPVELTKLGNASFTPPQVTSTVTIRGAAIDNQRVVQLFYALGKTEINAAHGTEWTDSGLHETPKNHHKDLNARWSGSLSNWSWHFDDIADVCKGSNAAYYVTSYDISKNLWLLPVKFKLIDVAGNVSFYSADIIVDPDADKPVVNINSHNERQIVGGLVRVSGFATDNEWINKVEIRITAQSNENCSTLNPPDVPVTGGKFVPVNIIGNKSSAANWYFNINENGELDPPRGGTRSVLLEVRVWDASIYSQDLAKNFTETRLALVFDLSVPVIEEIKVIHGAVKTNAREEALIPGTTVKEFVTLKAKITDDSGITSIKLRGKGEASYIEYIDKTNSKTGKPWVEAHTFNNNTNLYTEYTVYIPLYTNAPASDPNSLRGGMYRNSAGTYSVEIQVMDNTNPMPFITLDSFNLQIDNYYPMASFAGNLNAIGNLQIYGKAWDTGGANINVQGLSRMVVYFSRNGKLIDLTNGNDASAFSVSDQTAKIGRTGDEFSIKNEGTLQTLPFFPNVKQNDVYSTNEYGIVIDSNQSGPYSPRFTGPSADKEWQVTYPSANLKDGPLTVHYVVFDNADNATHYSRDIYIANNRPLFTNISLGTDIDGFNGVQPNEFMDFSSASFPELITASEINSDFRVRNNQFNMNINTVSGNGNLHYIVSHVKRSQTSIPVTNIVKGEVYTIADPGTGINWVNYGVFGNPFAGVIFTATHSHSELSALGLISGTGGSVYTYVNSGNTAKTIKSADNLSHNAQIAFASDSFSGIDGIEDSVKILIDGIHTPKYDKLFLIKVYDSTSENDQLSHAVLFKVAVDNNDITVPSILISPFYWNSSSDNSLYRNSKANGHIELETHLPLRTTGISGIDDLDPKVSGRVSFKGTAFDNNVIDTIKFSIGNFQNGSVLMAAKFNGANWVSDSGSEIDFNNNGWKFNANGFPSQAGHNVEWQLDFDSSFISGAARADNILTVMALDKAANSSNPGNFSQTAANAKTAHYRFDAVPYITEVETELSGAYHTNPSAFNRSALGGYPVREGETIIIKGFNFDDMPMTIEKSTFSGDLDIKVNGISSINNLNNNNAPYNKEPNNLNNNNLNDNRRLYVWNTGYLLNQRVVQSPFMRMAPDSMRYMSYGLYDGNGRLYIRKDNGTTEIEHWENRYQNTTVAFDESGEWYAASSNMTGMDYPYFTFYARKPTGNINGFQGTNKRMIMRMAYADKQFDLNRAKIPRLITQNTDSAVRGTDNKAIRIFLSYYDNGSSDNPVLFHFGTVGKDNNFGGDISTNNNASYNKHPQAQVVANNSTAYKGSVYTAVGALSNGLPVIAWYDRFNQSLIFSHGGDASSAPLNGTPLGTKFDDKGSIVSTDTATWQNNAIKIADFAGTHVDLIVDGGDNVHLAYYDVRNGGLHYAYIPALNANTTTARPNMNITNIQRARVDTYLSAGTKLMLNVRREGNLSNGMPKYVPYISYFHASFAETKNAIRVAWRKNFTSADFNGTDASDRFTGAWEVMTIPVETVPLAEEFICNGVPSAVNWTVPGGTSALHYNSNMNKTMLVGYMTTDWYEGAVLKDALW